MYFLLDGAPHISVDRRRSKLNEQALTDGLVVVVRRTGHSDHFPSYTKNVYERKVNREEELRN
jgi:hypothetical protein